MIYKKPLMKLTARVNFKMKKRKLNSTNPKYYPVKEEEVKDRKELIATIRKGRNRNINVYAVFSEIE